MRAPLASRAQAGAVGFVETWVFEVAVEVGVEVEAEVEIEVEIEVEVGISASGSGFQAWKPELRASSEASGSAQIGGGV